MRPLSVSELLDAWERGLDEPPPQRALLLLSAACPETSEEDLAEETVGRRDRRLLTLREWTFGDRLVSLAACPSCGERVESSFDVEDIRAPDPGEASEEPMTLSVSGYKLTCRLPNGRDLAVLAGAENLETARHHLLERCLLEARSADGKAVSPRELPEVALTEVASRMGQADPQGDVELALTCPACGHGWAAPFDIASFLWIEVDAWARTLLNEVHVLASAYGWREADVLALSPWRRRVYLELAGG